MAARGIFGISISELLTKLKKKTQLVISPYGERSQYLDNCTSKRPDVQRRCTVEIYDFGCHSIRRARDVLDLALLRVKVKRGDLRSRSSS